MATLGAPAALHGYRVQALYTLKRILTQANEQLIFSPENMEDLDVLNANGKNLELIQVKKYSPLQLSDLEPEKQNCFFRRALDLVELPDSPKITLVNFGTIGPEMQKAWDGDEAKQQTIQNKLKKLGYEDIEINTLFGAIKLIELDEKEEESAIYDLLSELHTGIDPVNALDLLHYWAFISMEKRNQIVYTNVVEKLNSVGQWQAERRDYHKEWFTTIKPIEKPLTIADNYEPLKQEFFEGGFTRYEHIVADLDFRRFDKEAEIKSAFENSNIVIIHAASGQGKTTLALRYLHENFPDEWRFSVTRIENIQHALSVANALNGFASAIQAPMAVFIDVNPHDRNWVELAQQLAKHPYLQILIAIREEDYTRANASTGEFNYVPVDLQFDEQEARQIFERAEKINSQKRFLNFSEAWDFFGGGGPLLEFVYLLTQTQTLQQRLQSQVNSIREEVREKQLDQNELHLLRLVVVASAFEARIKTLLLIDYLRLSEPSLSLDYFEKEYLFRRSSEGFLEGLHAIRSQILVKLLTDLDLNPWSNSANEVLNFLVEEDIQQFILNAAIERKNEFENLIAPIMNLRPHSWSGIAGVLRSLLWIDIDRYISKNKRVIEAAKEEFGSGWFFIANLNLPNEDAPDISEWWKSDTEPPLIPLDRQERFSKIHDMATPKNEMFTPTKSWLEKTNRPSSEPRNHQDWLDVAFILYWASYLKANLFSPPNLDAQIPFSALANVTYALHKFAPLEHDDWLQNNETLLQERLANELQILQMEPNGELLNIHFLVTNSEIEKRQTKSPLHAAAIERLQILRQLYPTYEKYGIQGYGFKLGEALKTNYDDTYKSGVGRQNLVPELVTWANGILTGIARYEMRVEDWSTYAESILYRRMSILTCLRQLNQGLQAYISKRKPVNIGLEHTNKQDWQLCVTLLENQTELPKSAVDPWGFALETSQENKDFFIQKQENNLVPSAIALRIYEPYLKIQRDYFFYFRNFLTQSINVMTTHFNLSKEKKKNKRKTIKKFLDQHGMKTNLEHLSTHNFWDAKQRLIEYQYQYRKWFGSFEANKLAEIAEEEVSLIQETWLLWHHFAHKPLYTINNPAQHIVQNTIKEKSLIDQWIKGALIKFNNSEQKATRHDIDLKLDNRPTLIIQMNIRNPLKLYDAFEDLIKKLNSKFRSIRYEDLKHYFVQESYEKIVIIPTIGGRLANENAWTLFSLSTILNSKPIEKQNWVSYQMQPLPQEWFDLIGLSFWNHPQIEIANEISGTVSGLMILASQISEFNNLPKDINDTSTELIQAFATEHSEKMSELLQKFIDHGVSIQNQLSELSDQDGTKRSHFIKAAETFHELFDYVLPSESESEEQSLSLSMIVEYAERLSEVFKIAEHIRLLLISDAVLQPIAG